MVACEAIAAELTICDFAEWVEQERSLSGNVLKRIARE
ncbi:hypothetical protein Pla52o_11770 [Novipirellula galeiformis]|uniref:Uncharacterized protein n=1 Tax=Novipirellula galeiformis TaxID=2528004 RepID=A0A5C6CNC4_9BACT|nr:hypothetical protein Pla52o_11770 [Novipirellula galeiformis]